MYIRLLPPTCRPHLLFSAPALTSTFPAPFHARPEAHAARLVTRAHPARRTSGGDAGRLQPRAISRQCPWTRFSCRPLTLATHGYFSAPCPCGTKARADSLHQKASRTRAARANRAVDVCVETRLWAQRKRRQVRIAVGARRGSPTTSRATVAAGGVRRARKPWQALSTPYEVYARGHGCPWNKDDDK